jgi:Holliday junction resolvase RusA-like endonuclease
MSDPVTIVLLGEPVGQGRPRFVRKSGVAYTPEKTRNISAALRIAAQQTMNERISGLFDEPLRLHLLAEFGVPQSWSQRKKNTALLHGHFPAKKPDISNILKLAEDALNGIVYRDDALIVEAHVRKVYGGQPKLVITVSPLHSAIEVVPL